MGYSMGLREKVYNLVESSKFKNFILSVILINGLVMGLETYKGIMHSYGKVLELVDEIAVIIFTIEIMLRIYAHGRNFFKDGWSLFDFAIVLVSLAPNDAQFSVLRILRVFRLFRVITVVPQMRKIVVALVGVIPGMISIVALMTVVFYIFAILATWLFGADFPQWFGDLGRSLYTLFQIMTLESWSMGIARPVMELHPYAWTFFLPFIFLATFIIINLIVAMVVDVMNEIGNKENKEESETTHLEIKELQMEIAELKELVKQALKDKNE